MYPFQLYTCPYTSFLKTITKLNCFICSLWYLIYGSYTEAMTKVVYKISAGFHD